MAQLNQLLAIEKQAKASANEQLTAVYQTLQKEQLLSGISRTYKPTEDDGERLPSESAPVQVRVETCLRDVARIMSPVFDVTLQKDTANLSASADIEVDGAVILKSVPATYLLWLEKNLADLHTVIVKLPTLPQSESWDYDAGQDAHRSASVETSRQKKIPRAFVKAEATDKHPAQVEVVHEDKLVGYWTTTKFSGAIPRQKAQELRDRIEKLQAAVKFAREKANQVQVPKVQSGQVVFDYLLKGL